MIKATLLVLIIIFYAIRWRPSVLRRIEKKNVNPRLLAGEIFILFLIVFQMTGIDPFKFQIPVYVNYIGLAIALAGAAIASIARLELKKNYVPATAAFASNSLTTDGIYKIVRHPAYIGTILAFIGFEIALNSYLIIIGIFLIIIIINQIEKEEKMLFAMHEEEWKNFTKMTPYKLIPFIY